MPERSQYLSLLPIDVGFDLRGTVHVVRLYGGFGYWYLDKDNKRSFAGSQAGMELLAGDLAHAGYTVVPFVTPAGENVMVLPSGTPSGGILWYIGKGNSLHLNQGPTLKDAISRSKWKLEDLQPLSSDEYM